MKFVLDETKNNQNQLSDENLLLTWGKLYRTPQVRKMRDPICGSVAMTGDLVIPATQVQGKFNKSIK